MKKGHFIALALLFVVSLISGCSEKEYDIYSNGYNFTYVISEAGFSVDGYIKGLETAVKTENDAFARADYLLAIGRLKNDKEIIAYAVDFYHKASEQAETKEEKALLYETIASLDGGRYYYLRAAEAWRQAKNKERMIINFNLAFGRKQVWEFDIKDSANDKRYNPDFSAVIIGKTRIELDENDFLLSQASGVTRNLFSGKLQNPFSAGMLGKEGAILDELSRAGIKTAVAAGTVVKESEGKWYAPNEKGVFMFEVPLEKVIVPTTRFLRRDIAVVMETNGLNMMVGQAIAKNATAIIGTCDDSGSAKAALYLSEKIIKAICNSDGLVPALIGKDSLVIGSASFKLEGNKVVYGDKPLEISVSEIIIAEDYSGKDAKLLGYGTPSRYFSELEKKGAKLNVFTVEIDGANQTGNILKKAEEKKAKIIAVRVALPDDYDKVKAWLEQDSGRKAILFSSENTDSGYKISREFRSQTSFDDPNPVVE